MRLILLRHAMSGWDAPGCTDHDRPLSDQGLQQAQCFGRTMASLGWRPTVVVSSTAIRALDTARAVLNAAGDDPARLLTAARAYLAQCEDLEAILEPHRDVPSMLLIGHNPGLEEAVQAWCGGPVRRISTCTAILIDVPADGPLEGRCALVDVVSVDGLPTPGGATA